MTEYNEKFPDGFIEYYLQFLPSCQIYGIPATEFTRDEALACMMSAFHDMAVLRAQHEKDLDVMAGKPMQ